MKSSGLFAQMKGGINAYLGLPLYSNQAQLGDILKLIYAHLSKGQ